jgi:hypothetical protein
MQSRPERLYRPLPPQKEGEMNQVEKAARFAELHVKGAPLLLYSPFRWCGLSSDAFQRWPDLRA